MAEVPSPSYATPITVVAPTFPKNGQIADAAGLKVAVVGTVLTNGKLEVRSVIAPEGQQVFADAVTDALAWWRFTPAVDKEACTAKATESSLEVWFSGTVERPKVELAYPRANVGTADGSGGVNAEWASKPTMQYPVELLMRDVEGRVVALYLVGPSGEVESASILSSTPYGVFDAVVLRDAKAVRLKWKASAPLRPVCVMVPYTFCIEGKRAKFSFEGCKH